MTRVKDAAKYITSLLTPLTLVKAKSNACIPSTLVKGIAKYAGQLTLPLTHVKDEVKGEEVAANTPLMLVKDEVKYGDNTEHGLVIVVVAVL